MAVKKAGVGNFDYEVIAHETAGGGETCTFYKRHALRESPERWVREADLREIGLLAGAAATALFRDRNGLIAYARFAAGLRRRRHHRKRFAGFARAMEVCLGITDSDHAEALFRRHMEQHVLRRVATATEWLARSERHRIELSGGDELADALSGDRGAIVWAAQFTLQTLLGKRALAEAGFPATQLSVGIHGFSDSRFGRSVINPVLIAAENNYLSRRLVFERDAGARVTREVIGLLERGELVLITNNVYSGSIFVEMPFGRSGVLSMPTTPLSIALRRQVPIFALAVIETEPMRMAEARLVRLNAPAAASVGRDYQAMATLVLQARDALLDAFSQAPEQYLVPESLVTSRFDGA